MRSLLFFFLFTVFWGQRVGAIPRRANEPWSVILCKFADLPNFEPHTKEWVEEWIHGSDEASIQTYFQQVSNGVYTIDGSNVVGWFQLPHTQKEILRLANSDPAFVLGSESGFNPLLLTAVMNASGATVEDKDPIQFQYFDKIKELCVQLALESGAKLHRQKITVVNSGSTAVYGKKHGVLVTPQLMFSAVLTHEMVHSFFIGHSYSDRKIRVFPYAQNGEYDDRYDLMSTANAYMHRSHFGMAGPGLNGAHLDFLGWLPMDRMAYFGRDGRQNYTLRLSSLSVPHNDTRGWLLVMIPYDRDDARNFYTVELRTPDNFDRGIQQASVLVHRVQRAGDSYYSVLLSQSRDFYELTENTEWVKFLDTDADGTFTVIKVSVRRLYAHDADIAISSTFSPSRCRWNETPRAAPNGTVCVGGDREPTEAEEQRQSNRNEFFSRLETFGANACKSGHVWRSLDPYDYVCVRAEDRDSALSVSDLQADRLNGTQCAEAFLERNAFPGDALCVSAIDRLLALRQNSQSNDFLRHFEFFNGVDTVGP